MQESKVAREISISNLKRNFVKKFPNSSLVSVLLREPDSMNVEELIGKAGTWLVFLQAERRDEK
ncbi:MAG: hypothetical protein ACYCSG_03165 [Thermoplasmataceae archaeon]|jgi:hypothetical protein